MFSGMRSARSMLCSIMGLGLIVVTAKVSSGENIHRVRVDEQIQFDISLEDPDGDTPTLEAEGLPVDAILNEVSDGVYSFSWSPAPEDVGSEYGVEPDPSPRV